MTGHNPTAKKTGFWLWKKTVVEHEGGTSVFSGSAQVNETAGSLCVKEDGLLNEQTVCFLKNQDRGAQTELPDGELASRSKTVELTLSNGEVKTYRSSILGVHSATKEGDQVVVKKTGLFGEREVDRISADQITAVKADHCKVCEAVNPLFKK